MKARRGAGLFLCAMVLASAPPAAAQEDPRLTALLDEHRDEICARFDALPPEACAALVTVAARSMVGAGTDTAGLEERLRTELRKPEFLNSALAAAFGAHVPLGIEFKSFDSENGDSALGLGFAANYRLMSRRLDAARGMRRSLAVNLSATGNIVNDSDTNPRDFIDAKLSVLGSRATDIPDQSEEFQAELTRLAVDAALCSEPEAAEREECRGVNAQALALLDEATAFLESFRRLEFGVEAGYEADQALEATQTKLGASFFMQHEDWGDGSFLGALNVTPSIRLALDTVDPDDETPRALAGDASSYQRLSTELSLWIPLANVADQPLILTFNYRHYRELDPSAVVKAANLDAFDLRTISLAGTNGLFVSYSSGRLPLDIAEDEVVQIGWRTYF